GGEELPAPDNWWTVYQGAFARHQWYTYLLPLGEDWRATYGDLPAITQLVYVNDEDGGAPGETYFDAIADVTGDLPVAPVVGILQTVTKLRRDTEGNDRATVQFEALVNDPDSATHVFHWDFGDSTFSDETAPQHVFTVTADHAWSVGLTVTDPDGLSGYAATQVEVDPGGAAGPITVNFVGDVFTGRAYEYAGGIIDTYGVEALFEPTLGIFGGAADVNVCNLEVSYTDRGTPHPTKSVVFRSRPENSAGIRYAGVDLAGLANNHIIDYGEIGMLDTMDLLDGLSIPYFGAGSDETAALQPAFRTERGIRLAFVGQCNRCGRKWNYQPFLDAGPGKPGFAFFVPQNVTRALDGLHGLADVVILQTHSGDEYETAPPPGKTAGPVWPDVTPEIIEATDIAPGDPDVRFRNEPSLDDRALRRLTLDAGADILINHHPHVLQGFEGYDGKLIAHSLGNFVFDLYYPETFPTLVLTLEIEKNGIVGCRFVPAWIDDYIPRPALGTLGYEIADRIADYSTPMNALVTVDRETNTARVYPDRAGIDSTTADRTLEVTLKEIGGWWVCAPTALPDAGDLSALADASGLPGLEMRWGREILWHGGFEDEGATFWDDNTADEWLDTAQAHAGTRSLALRRRDSDPDQTGTDLEKHLPCDPTREHSALGWLRAENAAEARIMVRFYPDRSSETPLSSTDLADRFTGSCDWTPQWVDLTTPGSAVYFELRCGTEPPAAGTGLSWFDDLALVEWEAWQPAGASASIPAPNNYRYVQVRSPSAAATVALAVTETVYGDPATAIAGPAGPPRLPPRLSVSPNPFNPLTTIRLELPRAGAADATVAIHDLRGRRVALLHRGPLRGEIAALVWKGRDDRGRALPSGIYLVRAEMDGQAVSRKITLVR
ncbi:CapA family protein, partial [bacterium]|nr:CapA family protein [bacterium]